MTPDDKRPHVQSISPLSWWGSIRARVSTKSAVAWLVVASGLLLASLPLADFLSSPGRTWQERTDEDFHSGQVTVAGALSVSGAFRASQDGWYLPVGTSGEIHYRIDKALGSHITAQLWLYMPAPSVTGELRIRTGARSRALTDPYFVGEVIELGEADDETSVELALSATNTGSTQALVLDQLFWGPTTGAAPPRPTAASFLAFGGLVGLMSLSLIEAGRWRWPISVAIGLLMALAASDRFEALYAHSADGLDPDAVTYRILVDRFRWWPPWESGLFSANFGVREPFFLMVAHAYFDVLGSSDFHLRVVSSTLSVLSVPLTFIAARRRLSWPAAFVVAGLVAFNRPLVDESFRGLRTELELCLVLVLYVLLDRRPSARPRWEAILTGLVGLALVLTRTFYLPMILVAVGISFLARYRPPRRALLPLSMAAALVVGAVVGHRLAMYERQGDAFFDTASYARWNANVEQFERGGHLSHPELFPTEIEYIEQGPYFGPRITYAQYLFELHTVPQVVAGTAAGFGDVFANTGGTYLPGIGRILGLLSPSSTDVAKDLTELVDQAVKWIGVVGLVGLLVSAVGRRRPEDLLLPAMVATGLVTTTFVYHLQLIERYRNTMQFYPLLVIGGAWLFQELLRLTLRGRALVLARPRTQDSNPG